MSLSAFTQKIEELNRNTEFQRQKIDEVYAALQAIDPSSPDAKSKRSEAIQAFNAVQSEFGPDREKIRQEALALRESLTGEERIQADQLYEAAVIIGRNTRDFQQKTVIPFSNALKDKIAAGNKETNPSEADKASEEKVTNAGVASASTSEQSSVDGRTQTSSTEKSESSPLGRTMPAPAGAMPKTPSAASVNFKSITGEEQPKDMRVKIRVPRNYLTQLTSGITEKSKVLEQFSGIIFPYTPQIGFEHKAEYSAQQPLHSNFTQYFYQRSSVSAINISGKFTVSNEDDAIVYIATIHLLRALTKMRYGGTTGDADSGSPPPVCRLDAYGTFQLDNVPVVISSFKTDLPDNVDYYTVGKKTSTIGNRLYEKTSVPVISTISLNLLPVYSRDEMQKFNVTQWLNEKYVRKAGYL